MFTPCIESIVDEPKGYVKVTKENIDEYLDLALDNWFQYCWRSVIGTRSSTWIGSRIPTSCIECGE